MNTKGIMIVGVGGQGSLLASKMLGNVLLACGYDVKISEVHGMSQRGGSVVTYVKYGDKVYSPLIDANEADYIIAFEPLEAARWLSCLKDDGQIIVNTQKVYPMPVITGAMEYPENLIDKLSEQVNVTALDALEIAQEAGNAKAVNIVLMGVISSMMDISEDIWMKALEANVPAKFLELNKKAFSLGRAYVSK